MSVGVSPVGPQELLNSLPDGVVVTDARGSIIFASDQALEIFGFPREELLGQSVEILVPDSFRETHREYREAYVRNPKVRPMGALELQAKRKDGSLFPVEISLAGSHTPDGLRIISTIRDIGRRKQMEEALHASEERYRRLIEEVKDYAIFMLDPEGRMMTWNEGARQMRGHRTEEILGRHVSVFFTPEDIKAGRSEEELREAAEKGRFETEGWRVRKDGSRFWAHVVLTALRDQNHQLLGFTKIARDITERKRASEAVLLEISNRLIVHLNLEDLLSAIAASLRQIKEYDYAGLALYDPAIQKLRVYALPSVSRKNLIHEELLLSMENSPAGWAIKARRPLVLNRVHENGRPFEIPANLIKQGVLSACRIPLIHGDRVLGTLNLASLQEGAFLDEEVSLLGQVANQIALALRNAISFRQLSELKEKLTDEKQYLEAEVRSRPNFGEIIGRSASLKQVLEQVETVAPTGSTVLILGETGTGKELIARAIHGLSRRRGGAFITVNCSALPSGLLESELFGHEKGAFTGSTSRKIGRLELAHRGTLFLDEVGDIPLDLQPKLLRALQERQFERLGSSQTINVDVRLIAATNRDLESMVEEGRFRSDLYYRLNVFPITLPPLRERAGDVPLLARYFLEKYSRRMGKTTGSIPAEVLRALSQYPWPGNIRELEHYIERAVILTSGAILQVPPLESKFQKKSKPAPASTLADAEREHILRILRETNGIVGGPRGAAARLGLKRTTLASKMRWLGISRDSV
ncbi:MAG TPA: sigma 54-interacting transcriptional regulator [Terriglobia bacterium]|nr:sigma 54-interacting transcriptional regulator [Terriglobia bacterium]